MSKTNEEVEALKQNWMKDPCWDIEDTEGFEEHKEELLAFHKEMEINWKIDAKAKDRSSFKFRKLEIENEIDSLDNQIGDGGSAEGWGSFVIAREQVRATLLLAEQVKRIGDLLAEKIEEDASSDSTEFMTRLYNVSNK